MGRLSTHVLDTVSGTPARGVEVALFRLDAAGAATLVARARTNADGRLDSDLMSGSSFKPGAYELVFSIGDYFRGIGAVHANPGFLETVPVRFHMSDPDGRYHVPLVCSPWAYSTYRGS